MDIELLRRKRRTYVNLAMCLVAIALAIATRHIESSLIVVFPGIVLHWMISNEFRLASEGRRYSETPWWTRFRLFVVHPAWSLIVIIFIVPDMRGDLSLWAMWAIVSLAFGFLLFKLYSRFIVIRMKLELPPEIPQSSDGVISSASSQLLADQAQRAYEARRLSTSKLDMIKKKVIIIIAVDVMFLTVLEVVLINYKQANPIIYAWLIPVLLVVNYLILQRNDNSDEGIQAQTENPWMKK